MKKAPAPRTTSPTVGPTTRRDAPLKTMGRPPARMRPRPTPSVAKRRAAVSRSPSAQQPEPWIRRPGITVAPRATGVGAAGQLRATEASLGGGIGSRAGAELEGWAALA